MKTIWMLILISLLFGCTTKVALKTKNIEEYAVNANITVYKKNGLKERDIGIGLLDNTEEALTEFKVDNGGGFSVSAAQPGQAIIYESGKISVTGDRNTFKKTVNIKSNGLSLDNTKSLSTISRSFKTLGEDFGAKPISLKNALNTRIGAIIVARPSSKKTVAKEIYSITPNIVGVKVLKLDDIGFPSTNETELVNISGNVAINASGSLGPLDMFGMNWESNSIYEMKWVLRGFGQVVKIEDPTKDPVAKLNSLSALHKKNIRKHLRENKGAKLIYIDKFYVLNRAELFTKKASRLSSSSSVSAADIVTADGSFTFSNSSEKTRGYGPVVLNYWGSEFFLETEEVVVNKTIKDNFSNIGRNGIATDWSGFFGSSGSSVFEPIEYRDKFRRSPTKNSIEVVFSN